MLARCSLHRSRPTKVFVMSKPSRRFAASTHCGSVSSISPTSWASRESSDIAITLPRSTASSPPARPTPRPRRFLPWTPFGHASTPRRVFVLWLTASINYYCRMRWVAAWICSAMRFTRQNGQRIAWVSTKLRVGLTRDILDRRGEPAFGPTALEILDRDPKLEWEYLPAVVAEIGPELAAQYDALYVNIARVPAAAVERADCPLRVVARHGVGYDTVDVAAMTRAGVLVTNTPTSMPRPVATTALTFVLALAGKLFLKDPLTRSGRWHERMDNMGLGVSGRTLGVVGAGGMREGLLRMARVFDLKLLAADPVAHQVEPWF